MKDRGHFPAYDAEARLLGIIRAAMDAIITVDADHKILLFNHAAEQMFRCSEADMIGRPLSVLLPSRFRERHGDYIRQFGETGVTTRTMGAGSEGIRALRVDGEEFPAEASISQYENHEGNKLYTVILRDITVRKAAEENLRESEQHLRRILNGMFAVVAVLTPEGYVQEVNEAFLQVVGVPLREVQNRLLWECQIGNDFAESRQDL